MARLGAAALAAALWLAFSLARAGPTTEDLLQQAERHHCGAACPHRGAAANLAAELRGSGFHRQLVYHLTVQCPHWASVSGSPPAQDGAAARQKQHCGGGGGGAEVAILQPLPPAIYANVYELDNAAAVGQGPQVKLFGPVDVESIEQHSQPTLLVVYGSSGGGSAGANQSVPSPAQSEPERQVTPPCHLCRTELVEALCISHT